MNVSQAVANRVLRLLAEKNITQYRLEKLSGIQHGSMACIMNGRTKGVMLNTVIMIARGFDMTVQEFLDDEVFKTDELEVE